MIGVLIGFAIIGAIIGLGYLIGRSGMLGPRADFPLSRLAFFVLTPALVFTVLAEPAEYRQVIGLPDSRQTRRDGVARRCARA